MIYVNRQLLYRPVSGAYILITGIPPYTVSVRRTNLHSVALDSHVLYGISSSRESLYSLRVEH